MPRRSVTYFRTFMLIGALMLAMTTQAIAGGIWYVNHAGSGSQDGRSWGSAFRSLQSALTMVAEGDEVWVAQGSYYPDVADPAVSFVLRENTSLYGGFNGTETAREQRDVRKYPTILSGNIGKGDKTRNTRTIVMGANNAILDGFTISGAYAVDEARMHLVPTDILKNDMAVGGGMRNFMVSPIVRNCIFRDNYSPKGGAVYNVHKPGGIQAKFINVDFIENTAQVRGGAVSNDLGAMPVFINCRFSNNRSQDKGGALYNDFAASPLLLNCLFENNSAVSAGAIGNDGGSSPLLVNVTIKNNRADSGLGGGLYQGTGANNNPVLIKTIVDSIYNWHEDLVAVLDTTALQGQTVALNRFIAISELKGQITEGDLRDLPNTAVGYQPTLDGNGLLLNPLVVKLLNFLNQNNATITYREEYTRPAVQRTAAAGAVIYVAPTAAGVSGGDGSSWKSPLTDLQQAIELASLNKAQVWVKAGTYKPARREEGRIAAFILYDNIKLYGGFDGTETMLTQRGAGHATILSARTTDGDFRYPHVLYGANNAALDGLTIRDGKADGMTYNGKGGGLLAYHAGKTFLPHDPAVGFTLTINNCRFEDNEALEGGAVYTFGKAALTVTETVFTNNRAVYGGAVMDREGNRSSYTRCSFTGNSATADGGAYYADYGSHVTFSGNTFSGNSAKEHGGAIYLISRASQLEATEVSVEGGDFSNNTAAKGSSIVNIDTSVLTVKNAAYPAGSISGSLKQ